VRPFLKLISTPSSIYIINEIRISIVHTFRCYEPAARSRLLKIQRVADWDSWSTPTYSIYIYMFPFSCTVSISQTSILVQLGKSNYFFYLLFINILSSYVPN
jgi:hypothetical protein